MDAPLPAIRGARELARFVDHTLLRPSATAGEVEQACAEAREWGFAAVCLELRHIALAARLLEGCPSRPIAVVGFPSGTVGTEAKVAEARAAVAAGAAELDMVIDLRALQGREYAAAEEDIRAVVRAAGAAPVKVILETCALTRDEKVIGCGLARAAGAAFVKTSTGFGPGGATVEDIALLRATVGAGMGVKASGGIRTTADALRMIAAGASRIGASASVAIVSGLAAASPAPGSRP